MEKNYLLLFSMGFLALWLSLSSIVVYCQLPSGIPRGDLIVIYMKGRVPNPEWGNVWIPGATVGTTVVFEPLYYYNVSEPRLEKIIIPCLAADLPEYSDDYTRLRIRVKEGVYWSDGVEFTAEDVVFTIKLINRTDGFAGTSFWRTWLKNVYAEDKYTFVIELKKPNPRFHLLQFTEIMAAGSLRIMPKHIWERVEDPLKFPFFPPVSTGPYKLKDYDPNGYWFLFERREDWYRTGIGKTFGKPKPKYVLRVYLGTTEKELIAQARHELDFMEVDVKLLKQAFAQNPYAACYRLGWPVIRIDAGGHGPAYNCAKYPFNMTDVRWALTLAINITEVDITLFEGRAGLCSFDAVSNPFIRGVFKDLYLPWLRNFTLPDGYKPFDETIPDRLAEWARLQGYEVIGDPRDLIGDGWWRYDVEEASKLLEKHGFYKDEQGRWHLPDGTLWKINIVCNVDDPLFSTMGFVIAEQWRKFGIDVTLDAVPLSVYTKRWQLGDFDVGTTGIVVQTIDIWRHFQSLHKNYYKPIGEIATSNQMRWVNDEFSALLDKLSTIPPFTPEAIRLGFELVTIFVKEMPLASVWDGRGMVMDSYVWTNWPVYETNWYWEIMENPVWQLPMLVYLKPSGNVPSSELYVEYVNVWFVRDVPKFIGSDGSTYGPYNIGDKASIPKDDADRLVSEGLVSLTPPTYNYITVYAKSDIPQFRGVDGKTYGPYRSGDVMIIPKEDADKLLAEGKVTATPTIPGIDEIIRGISTTRDSVASLKDSITTAIEKQTEVIEALKTSINNLQITLYAILAITIITAALTATTIKTKKT